MSVNHISTFVGLLVYLATTAILSAQVRLESTPVSEDVDGMASRYLALTGDGFAGRYFGDGNWLISEETNKDSSLSFDHRFVDDLRMDLGVFTSNALLIDYSEEALKSYTAAMLEKFTAQGLSATNVKAEKSGLESGSFMGRAYWHVRVEFNSPQTGLPSMYVSDFLSVGQNGRNFRLRFSGDPEIFSRIESKFVSILGDFMVE